MFLIIGSIIVVGSVLGGYVALGGHLIILWQPFELVMNITIASHGLRPARESAVRELAHLLSPTTNKSSAERWVRSAPFSRGQNTRDPTI